MDCSFLTNNAFNCLTLAQADPPFLIFGISIAQLGAVAGVFAVLILPFVFGNFIAKSLKMPNYGTRLGWILLAITASVVVLAIKRPGLGVDLSGGTILVYELDPEKLRDLAEEGGQRIKSEDLIEPLTRRINPSGTQEIVLRPYGDKQLEIIVPEVDQLEVDRIKKLIAEAGVLQFAIVANTTDHTTEIEAARTQANEADLGVRTKTNVTADPSDKSSPKIAFWANVDREKKGVDGSVDPFRVDVSRGLVRNGSTGEILSLASYYGYLNRLGIGGDGQALADWADSEGISGLEVLMVYDEDLDVTGSDLAFAASTFDQNGSPAVAFTLTDLGSGKFFALTTNNAPVGDRQRQLGIVLDDNLLSAPNILQPIRKDGRITGSFTREEVQSLVQILKAGQLPTALTKQPIAENQIDATLGADTITKGVRAITGSLCLVLVFIAVYYRFSGIVACIALVMNLGMILGTMVLINQPLTLPGLAGLVLTVGMSVDANVLIFERIREELKKGAASRMAIRNGFAKASVTIIDANLTTLITAIVLYAIGTDQIRGFAVTLILGILFSMFTAIYVSRTLFDIAERHGKISLKMSDMVNAIRAWISGDGGMDFIGKGKMTLAISGILLVVGVASLFVRGKGIFDIDFAGGSSVQFRVSSTTTTDAIRAIVKKTMVDEDKNNAKIPFTVNGVSIDGSVGTCFKVDSSQENLGELKDAVIKAFENSDVKLVTYSVKRINPEDVGNEQSWVSPNDNGVMLIAAPLQEPEATTPQEPEATTPQEPEAAAPQEPEAATP
ncbi:MAG: protein translocase subunit SecD, partial [Rubripirellula sp.]|nr:protein translocase subunit SecD [Rubripirellula sp.]